MDLRNPTNVKMVEALLRNIKPITKKDPTFLKRAIETILRDHQTAVHLGFSLFKIRVARPNTGKSGGYRVFYYIAISQTAYIVACVDKKDRENLTEKEINDFRELTEILEKKDQEQEQS